MGVLAGRFILATQMVATILAAYLVLGERLSLQGWIGIALIIAGVLLVGVR
jgi:drug/metabolite transporter (DMT)-like permease